jgi:hypothetical protein
MGPGVIFPLISYCIIVIRLMIGINQLKKALRDKVSASRLSVRVLADALGTSPSQVVRLLEVNKASKQLVQLCRLAELAGYRIECNSRKSPWPDRETSTG